MKLCSLLSLALPFTLHTVEIVAANYTIRGAMHACPAIHGVIDAIPVITGQMLLNPIIVGILETEL